MVDFREVTFDQFRGDDDYLVWRSRACAHWRAPGGMGGIFCLAPQSPSDLDETWKVVPTFRYPWRYLADARRFRHDGNPAALFGHFLLHGPRMAREHGVRVERGAVLLPDDWTIAWWLGGLEQWRMPDTRVWPTPEAAWEWLAWPELGPAVEALTVRLTSEHLVIARAQEALGREPGIDLDGLARRLGLSRRSLQRELSRANRTFADLRDRARVARAKELVERGGEKIEAIAREVGFRSRSHFAEWFRERTGLAPVEARRRGEAV